MSTEPGTAHYWSVGVTEGGWSPWNYLDRCDVNGANCHTGFHTIFYYELAGGPVTPWGIDGAQFETATHSDFYATPQLAFAHVFAPLQLQISSTSSFHAFIPDCCYGDNTGGLSITVAPSSPTVAPEPSTFLLAALGAVVTGLIAKRRMRPAD